MRLTSVASRFFFNCIPPKKGSIKLIPPAPQKIDEDPFSFIFFGPIVQWIEFKIPVLKIEVRVLLGSLFKI